MNSDRLSGVPAVDFALLRGRLNTLRAQGVFGSEYGGDSSFPSAFSSQAEWDDEAESSSIAVPETVSKTSMMELSVGTSGGSGGRKVIKLRRA